MCGRWWFYAQKGAKVAFKLTRRRGETVWIGDVLVTVLKTGSQVRLEIAAPRDVVILRGEVKERDQRNKQADIGGEAGGA